MIKKNITCISCPIGCRITAEITDNTFNFSGNKCKKGEDFAKAELTNPLRSLTTTVKTAFPEVPVLPVRTQNEIPKDKINDIISKLSGIIINERIGIGEMVADGIISTTNILKEQ